MLCFDETTSTSMPGLFEQGVELGRVERKRRQRRHIAPARRFG